MSTSSGPSFIDRVISLFKETPEPAVDPDTLWEKKGIKPSEDSSAASAKFGVHLPSEKARETNLDRYKHSSDLTGGY